MNRVPDTRPQRVHVGSLRDDLVALLEISFTLQWLIGWLPRALRWMMLAVLALFVIESLFLVVVGHLLLAVALAGTVAALMTLAACLVIADAVYRLMDRNRLVLFSNDRQASIDVIFGRRDRVLLREHGRVIDATSAPALRADVAAWIRTLDGAEVDVRTWNAAIAALCTAEFPELTARGRDGIGRIRLVWRSEMPASGALSRTASDGSVPAPAEPPRS